MPLHRLLSSTEPAPVVQGSTLATQSVSALDSCGTPAATTAPVRIRLVLCRLDVLFWDITYIAPDRGGMERPSRGTLQRGIQRGVLPIPFCYLKILSFSLFLDCV